MLKLLNRLRNKDSGIYYNYSKNYLISSKDESEINSDLKLHLSQWDSGCDVKVEIYQESIRSMYYIHFGSFNTEEEFKLKVDQVVAQYREEITSIYKGIFKTMPEPEREFKLDLEIL